MLKANVSHLQSQSPATYRQGIWALQEVVPYKNETIVQMYMAAITRVLWLDACVT